MNKYSNNFGGYGGQQVVDLDDGMEMDDYGIEYYDEEAGSSDDQLFQ